MNQIDPGFLDRSRAVFLDGRPSSLAGIKALIENDSNLPATARRDLVSALNRIEALFGTPLPAIPATPAALREIFQGPVTPAIGVSKKTLANLRSNAIRAVRMFAPTPKPVTRRVPIDHAWRTLLERVPLAQWRQGLYRLACFCSAMDIPPSAVSQEVLLGLFAALEAEEAVQRPKDIIKNTISNWNRCQREVEGWPPIRLGSPFKTKPYTLPLDSFPEGFRAEVRAYVDRVSNPDPFDETAPAKPLRQQTIDYRVFQLRQFATAVTLQAGLPRNRVTGFAVLADPENFKAALRFFLERSGRKTGNIHNLGNALRRILCHHLALTDVDHDELRAICKRIDPRLPAHMNDRNRERLRQFDDKKNVAALLLLPEKLMARAQKMAPGIKAARLSERAVAISFLIHFGLRLLNLRTLRLDQNILWTGSGMRGTGHLVLPGDQMKTGRGLEFELARDLAELLHRHLTDFRPLIPGAESDWLFPGNDGQCRSKQAMGDAITSTVRRETGLLMHPHLFRHLLAKLAIEQDPAAAVSASRVLGHSTMSTTFSHYLGTEGKAAARHLDRLLGSYIEKET